MAHFHVIHMASALTSAIVTPGWFRIPPFVGPLWRLCCTRYPVKSRIDPSSMWTGKLTVRTRCTSLRISRTPGSMLRYSAARSNWRWAVTNGSGPSDTSTLPTCVVCNLPPYLSDGNSVHQSPSYRQFTYRNSDHPTMYSTCPWTQVLGLRRPGIVDTLSVEQQR